jgi:hypothetical protein
MIKASFAWRCRLCRRQFWSALLGGPVCQRCARLEQAVSLMVRQFQFQGQRRPPWPTVNEAIREAAERRRLRSSFPAHSITPRNLLVNSRLSETAGAGPR